MKQLDIEAYHPITLEHIEYLQFEFARLTARLEPPFLFPTFEVNILDIQVQDDLTAHLIMQVATTPIPESADPEEKLPVLRFSFTLIAHFSCVEYEGAKEALDTFMAAETPSLIAWPYVRGFVADMVNRAGLPDYHLPLLQIRVTSEEQESHSTDSESQA